MNHICNILIKDECNIVLQNLDPKTRRLCKDALTYKVPNAYFIRSVRLGRWDGRVSFCNIGGHTHLNLLPILYPIIQQQGYDFTIEDHRPDHTFDFPEIDNTFLSDKTWQKGHRFEGQPIILEDHQLLIINTFLKNKQGVCEGATGAGKTVIVATLSKIIESKGRSIVIVPSKDLVVQTEDDYKNIGLDVGVFYGKRKELGKKHTICTWQSLSRLNKNSKNALSDIEIDDFLKDVIMVLVDECHLASGKELVNLLSDPFRNVPLRWGLTGTVPRDEHLRIAIEALIGDKLATVSAAELQEKGFLADCEISIEQFKNDSEFPDWTAEDQYISSNKTLLQNMATRILEVSKTGNTFVLVTRKQAGENLQQMIPGSVFLSGMDKVDDRKEEYDDMNTEDKKVIIATFGIASTGINIPRIFNLILFNPGKSFVRTIQSIGRGLRKARDKNKVQIYDMCFSTKYSKRHLTERKKYYKDAGYRFTFKRYFS